MCAPENNTEVALRLVFPLLAKTLLEEKILFK